MNKKPVRRTKSVPPSDTLSLSSSRTPANRSQRKKVMPVVGVGASAGGMQAFKDLLHRLPCKLNMALVLVQHLEPHHESILTDILARETEIPVVQGKNNQRVQAGHIYIIPPNAYISIVAGQLKISPRSEGVTRQFLPIDHFLNSLAKERKKKAVAVILSGTGVDGTLGVKAVKAAGGTTIAQDQNTAAFPEMPASAIAAKAIDLVLSPKEIAAKLESIALHPGQNVFQPAVGRKDLREDHVLDDIFRLLQKSSGVDFSHYKHTTILRRIKRRTTLHNLKNLKEYAAYLEAHPEETELLFQDFLIPVTSFFRDPKYFSSLEKKVYPALITQRNSNDTIRIWVPGCSTGEEVYSLAISLSNFMSTKRIKLPIQIFGTDVSETAIAKARTGSYSAAISKELPAPLLHRYFVKTAQGYRIDKTIRDLCLFSRQNIIADPPFSNVDLLSFRNVLIYMDASLQSKIIPLLHFSLKPGGFLMLGTSESISSFPALFSPLDKRYRIFIRKPTSHRGHFSFTPTPFPGDKSGTPKIALETFFPEKEVDRLLIKKYIPAGVLVNNQLDILQFRGHTGAFLEPAAGRATMNLLGMAREGLWSDLRKAIDAARKQATPVKRHALVKNDHGLQNVMLDVTPLHSLTSRASDKYFFIAFETLPTSPKENKRPGRERIQSPVEEKGVLRLKRENSELKEYLQSFQLEMDNASEELKAAQEEMQSSNEELQSMNEELETSKEELQSSNEELLTTNEELKNKNQDLLQTNNDLSNVLSGIELPLVILDNHLCIRRFTTAAKKLINVVHSDIGRSISDIKLKITIPELEQTVSEVITTVHARTLEIGDPQRGWYNLVVKPYITLENKIEGALLVFYDITRIKESLLYSENIIATLREPVIVLNSELKVVSANRAFYETFRVNAPETEGRYIYHLGNHQWDLPQLRELLEKIIPSNATVDNYMLTNKFPGIGTKTMLLNARRINPANGGTTYTLLAMEDITKRHLQEMELKLAQDELQEANRHKDEFLAMLAHELRNPLSPIRTSLELIQQEREGQSEKIIQWVERIRGQVYHLTHIVDDLMDTSRISRGLVILKKERINLVDLVRQAVEAFLPRLEGKHQTLAVREPEKPLFLEADPVRVVQILSNLLDNAHKYTPVDGSIELRVQPQGREALVEVQDTGIGISAEALPRVFDLFFQSERYSYRTKGGLGIGLTLAKNLATLHGGTLAVHSEGPNRGTIFSLRLPLWEETQTLPTPSVPTPAANPVTKLKIMVVEDQRISAESLVELLQSWKHEVHLAHDGQSALQLAETVRPDVILLDIGLPDINGYQVAARLRANPALSHTALVALTGYNPDKSRADHGIFNEYFTKPAEVDILKAFLSNQKPKQ